MKILLLGANGMLGSCLRTLLNKACPNSFVALGKSECDISSLSECTEIIERKVVPNIVINAAAITNVDACESNQEEAFRVNAEGPKNLAICCAKIKARLIHFSTDYVFDGKKQNSYLETDIPNPINIYGKSKLEGERLIQKTFDNFLIIRVAGLFGRDGNNFVYKIKAKLSENSILNIADDQTVSFTYTKDLAETVIKLLYDKTTRSILNVTNGGYCSWWEFSKEIVQLSKDTNNTIQINPIKISSLSLPAIRPLYSVLSGDLFEQVYGYKLRHWKYALADFITDIG